MDKEFVSKWVPGEPTYQAALPAPTVHYLSGHVPECRLIAVFYAAVRDPYAPPEAKLPYVKRMLHLDYALGLDPLGNHYWRDLDDLAEEDQPEVCQAGCPGLKVCRTLMTHLAAALGIPSAADVEAGLNWEEVPECGCPAREEQHVEAV